jgi:hypothetical protein
MMTMILTLSTILVVGLVGLVRMDRGSEVMVEREGELKGRVKDWTARSTLSLAHQLINTNTNKNIPMTC